MITNNDHHLTTFLNLLTLHRGEAGGSYNKVAPVYDSFAKIWDGYIAAPALNEYNQIIQARSNRVHMM